jgi:hypothetical protein
MMTRAVQAKQSLTAIWKTMLPLTSDLDTSDGVCVTALAGSGEDMDDDEGGAGEAESDSDLDDNVAADE